MLSGRSWSGHAPIRRVEVSTDGGATLAARPAARAERAAGRTGSCPGRRTPGRHELLARATDRSGLTQPDTVPFNEGGYQFWAVVRHPVTARQPEAKT